MKTIPVLLVGMPLSPMCLQGQKVFRVDYESQADKKLYFVAYESQADLKILKVK